MLVARRNDLIVSIFVDDIKIMRAKNLRVISQVKKKLMATFEMADMGPISFYFGLKVSWNCKKRTIKLFQLAYIDKILAKFYLFQVNTSNTLLKKIPLESSKKKVNAAKQKHY